MKKEALINIIINDLKEVQKLMEDFRGEIHVNSAFVNLAKTKIRNIEEEMSLLDQEFGRSTFSTNNVEEKRLDIKEGVKGITRDNSVEKKEIKEGL